MKNAEAGRLCVSHHLTARKGDPPALAAAARYSLAGGHKGCSLTGGHHSDRRDVNADVQAPLCYRTGRGVEIGVERAIHGRYWDHHPSASRKDKQLAERVVDGGVDGSLGHRHRSGRTSLYV
eukprot:5738315-Prymnesium_polylepis.1